MNHRGPARVSGFFGDSADLVDHYIAAQIVRHLHRLLGAVDPFLKQFGRVVAESSRKVDGGNAQVQIGDQFPKMPYGGPRHVRRPQLSSPVDFDAVGSQSGGGNECCLERLAKRFKAD